MRFERAPRTLILCGVVGVLVVVCIGIFGGRESAGSLADWVQDVRRPGFRLLCSEQTETHQFAIFYAGDSRIAFCSRRVDSIPSSHVVSSSVEISDSSGRSLYDWDRDPEMLTSVRFRGLLPYEVADGDVIPIERGYVGSLRIQYSEDHWEQQSVNRIKMGQNGLPRLDVTIDWPGKEAT